LVSNDDDAAEKFEVENFTEAVLWLASLSQLDPGCECAGVGPESLAPFSPGLHNGPGSHVYLGGHQ
jgi:hypothetical protein